MAFVAVSIDSGVENAITRQPPIIVPPRYTHKAGKILLDASFHGSNIRVFTHHPHCSCPKDQLLAMVAVFLALHEWLLRPSDSTLPSLFSKQIHESSVLVLLLRLAERLSSLCKSDTLRGQQQTIEVT